mmetsp:Transcript_2169/g.4736  ORF Transcript_2169/g.4736 Transcript_2169/m.4736 type:complete len:162 (+) Transcript_2169:1209-1694(+)
MPKSPAAREALSETPRDPDDVQLLPSTDKLDMRSIYSDEVSTDVETENYNDENFNRRDKEVASKYGNLYGAGDGGAVIRHALSAKIARKDDLIVGNKSKDETLKVANGGGRSRTSGGASSLAAIGVASTLAARSYTPAHVINPNSATINSPATSSGPSLHT